MIEFNNQSFRTTRREFLLMMLVFLMIVISFSTQDAKATTPVYTTIKIPGFLDSTIHIEEMNNLDEIVGNYEDPQNGHVHGFLYSNFIFTTIDVPGSTYTMTKGINDNGEIVGYYEDGSHHLHGFLYVNGIFTTIDVPGAFDTEAFDINNHGEIVGYYYENTYNAHGFLYSNGIFTTIDYPAATGTQAHGINDVDEIVGSYGKNDGVTHGFLYAKGTFDTIDVPGFPGVLVLGINNAHEIVGKYWDHNYNYYSFIRSNIDLTAINFPGAYYTVVSGINDIGEIFGYYFDSSGGHNFLMKTPFPDLSLDSMEVIQSASGVNTLVDNKPAIIEVTITSSFPSPKNANIRIEYSTMNPSNPSVQMTKTFDMSAYIGKGTNTYYIQDPSGYIRPYSNSFTVKVTIDPSNDIMESNKNNNHLSKTYKVAKTKTMKVLYIPVRLESDKIITCDDVKKSASYVDYYLRSMYPLDPDRPDRYDVNCVNLIPFATKDPDVVTNKQQNFILDLLAKLGWISGVDKVVGFVDDNWSDKVKADYPGGTWVGSANLGQDSALVKMFLSVTLAHEIAHTFYWVQPLTLVRCWDNSIHTCNLPAPGFFVTENNPEKTSIDFMEVKSVGGETFWISSATFNYLLSKLKINPSDPKVIGISGTVFKNGTTILDPWYVFESVPDVPLDNVGNITAVYKDSNGHEIARTGFDIYFRDMESNILQNETSFALRIPYVDDISSIVLLNETGTMAQRNVSPNPPNVTIIEPNGGEKYASGQAVNVSWHALDSDNDALSYSVLMSKDDGTTWIPLATDLSSTSFSFIPSDIHTNSALVKVIATDGFNTSNDTSDSVFSIGADNVVSSFSGSGNVTFDTSSGVFSSLSTVPDLISSSGSHPYGFFDWTVSGFSGDEITITTTYPNAVQPDSKYETIIGDKLESVPLIISENKTTMTITDNGPFDSNPTVGVISNRGGLEIPSETSTSCSQPTTSLGRVPTSNPRIVDSLGNTITGIVGVGQQIQVAANLINCQISDQPFAYLLQIQDSNNVTVYLSWITGTIPFGQSLSPTQSWIPHSVGTYTAQIFVWESIDDPNALSLPLTTTIKVE